MPIMVTGGFRTRCFMTEALAEGELDVVGLGRPMITAPETPHLLLTGEIERASFDESRIGLLQLIPWYSLQLERLGDGLDPDLALDGAEAVQRFVALETGYFAALLARRRLAA